MEKTEKLTTQEEKLAALEAVLFAYGEALPIKKIASILGISSEELDKILHIFSESLTQPHRGLSLVINNDQVMLATKPNFSSLLEDLIKEDLKEDLTPAASETLALVAYFGPISRAHIDFVRGVNSSFMLRGLLMRGLVERKTGKGNAYEYEISVDFLKYMGVASVQELPEYETYQELKQKYFEQEKTISQNVSAQ